MHEYETVLIYHPSQSEAQYSQVNERIEAVIKKNNGHIFFARNMGMRTFAYPILKETKGTYFCFDFAAAGNTVAEIERLMRLDETVIRFLTITKNKDVDVEARSAEIVVRGEDGQGSAAEENTSADSAAKEGE